MPTPKFIPLKSFEQYPNDEMINRSQEFYKFPKRRRDFAYSKSAL